MAENNLKKIDSYFASKIKALPDHEVRMFERSLVDITTVKKIHLVGICGTAMGSLAALLCEKGYVVSGSDSACYPPMSDVIAALGIAFYEGYAEKNLVGTDLIIIGNACGPNNPEALHARQAGMRQLSLPEAINLFFIQDRRSLVVAGTHGKTTTTGLLAHVFKAAGCDPGFLIGGVMQTGSKSQAAGGGNYFIIEGDEYDSAYFDKRPKFLHYRPTSAIVTSVEFDHADIYRDMAEYRQAFEFFVSLLPVTGTLFLYGDDPNVRALHDHAQARVVTYGMHPNNTISIAGKPVVSKEGQTFILTQDGIALGEVSIMLFGDYNLLNTLAVCGMALSEGISFELIRSAISTFPGMKRRQEITAEKSGITVIDDFAHHPTAVRETVRGIRERYPSKRLVAVFEPRSNTSRKKIFEPEYAQAFGGADEVILCVPPLRHNDKAEDFFSVEKVTEEINKKIPAHSYGSPEEVFDALQKKLQPNTVFLVMSNGSFGGLVGRLTDVVIRLPDQTV